MPIHKSCKAKTRSGRKCRRLGSKDCEKNGMCSQHYKMFKNEKTSVKSKEINKKSNKKLSKKQVRNLNQKQVQNLNSMQTYNILDNGGNPFKVEVSNEVIISDDNDTSIQNIVSIYIRNYIGEDSNGNPAFDDVLFKTYYPTKVFVGKSIINKMTEFSGALDKPKFDGNSILLEIDPINLRYVYIGYEIYSFTAYAKIKEYVSPVGNSQVPYPYAVDELNNYYLMIENIVLEGRKEIEDLVNDKSDPYDYYYDNSKIGGNFEDIKSLKIGNENYLFTYKIEDYDHMKTRFQNQDFYMIKNDDTEELLTKEKYDDLMERFADSKKFMTLLDRTMIHDRL